MPRALRIQYPGAIYHLMKRGDRRKPIFRDELDRKKFLTTLAERNCTWELGRMSVIGSRKSSNRLTKSNSTCVNSED